MFRKGILIVFFVLLLGLIQGCGSKGGEQTTAPSAGKEQAKTQEQAPAPKTTKIKIGYAAKSGVFTPIYVLAQEKLLQKYGIEAEVVGFRDGPAAVQSLIAGDTQIQAVGGDLIEAALSGTDLRYVASISNTFGFSLYGRADLKDVKDLKGKKAGANGPNSSTDYGLREVIKHYGLEPGKDVQIMYLGGAAETLAGLQQGVVDAIVGAAPSTIKAREAGFKELANLSTLNIPFVHGGIGVSEAYAQKNPEVMVNFLKAFVEAMNISVNDPAKAKSALGKTLAITDPLILDDTYKAFEGLWSTKPYISAEAVQNVLNYSLKPNAKTAKPSDFIDNSFLDKALGGNKN